MIKMTTLDHLILIRAQCPNMSLSALILLLHMRNGKRVTDYGDCAKELGFVHRVLVYRASKFLESRELITCDKNEDDWRYRILTITEKGRKLVEEM